MTVPSIRFRRMVALQRWISVAKINDTIHVRWRFPWDGRDYV